MIETSCVSPPGVLLYYLMFIYYHQLNDIPRRQDCLHDLILYVTRESPKVGLAFQYFSLRYLQQAFTMITDTESAANCHIMIETLIESTDLKTNKQTELPVPLAKHAPLRRKNKDWLARNQNNVSTRRLLFQ